MILGSFGSHFGCSSTFLLTPVKFSLLAHIHFHDIPLRCGRVRSCSEAGGRGPPLPAQLACFKSSYVPFLFHVSWSPFGFPLGPLPCAWRAAKGCLDLNPLPCAWRAAKGCLDLTAHYHFCIKSHDSDAFSQDPPLAVTLICVYISTHILGPRPSRVLAGTPVAKTGPVPFFGVTISAWIRFMDLNGFGFLFGVFC